MKVYHRKQEILQNSIQEAADMKKRVVCYGDSHTWGYVPGTGERYDESIRWTCLLQEKLGPLPYDLVLPLSPRDQR